MGKVNKYIFNKYNFFGVELIKFWNYIYYVIWYYFNYVEFWLIWKFVNIKLLMLLNFGKYMLEMWLKLYLSKIFDLDIVFES